MATVTGYNSVDCSGVSITTDNYKIDGSCNYLVAPLSYNAAVVAVPTTTPTGTPTSSFKPTSLNNAITTKLPTFITTTVVLVLSTLVFM